MKLAQTGVFLSALSGIEASLSLWNEQEYFL
jgi:hypothetical protein